MLPDEWRAKRRVKFRLETLGDIPDGTKVTIACGSIRNPSQELRNNIAVVNNSAAEFDDLRFEGKSGRGTYSTLTIHVATHPTQVVTYRRAIKVTHDGKRRRRNKSGNALHPPQKNSLPEFFHNNTGSMVPRYSQKESSQVQSYLPNLPEVYYLSDTNPRCQNLPDISSILPSSFQAPTAPSEMRCADWITESQSSMTSSFSVSTSPQLSRASLGSNIQTCFRLE